MVTERYRGTHMPVTMLKTPMVLQTRDRNNGMHFQTYNSNINFRTFAQRATMSITVLYARSPTNGPANTAALVRLKTVANTPTFTKRLFKFVVTYMPLS